MEQHMESSLKVAQFLEKHPLVERVIHPGIYIKLIPNKK